MTESSLLVMQIRVVSILSNISYIFVLDVVFKMAAG